MGAVTVVPKSIVVHKLFHECPTNVKLALLSYSVPEQKLCYNYFGGRLEASNLFKSTPEMKKKTANTFTAPGADVVTKSR